MIIHKHRTQLFILFFILSCTITTAYTHTSPPNEGEVDKLIYDWDRLPFKHQMANASWAQYVNSHLNPYHNGLWDWGWDVEGAEELSVKCLSYAASTTADWIKLSTGMILPTFSNFVNNRMENGTNPRELEAIYHNKPNYPYPHGKYSYTPLDLYKDGVTGESVPYNIEGFSEILTNPPSNWIEQADPEISSFKHNVTLNEYLGGYNYQPIIPFSFNLKNAINRYGIIYAHLHNNILPNIPLPIHAVTLIGHDTDVLITDFWVHDSYDGADGSEYSRYASLMSSDVLNAFVFYDTQWPTFHHDLRRTGFTLLRGDMESLGDVDKISWTMMTNVTSDHFSRPSIANLDDNDMPEIIVTTSKVASGAGSVYAVEYGGSSFVEKWNRDIGNPVQGTPAARNLDSDSQLEISFGLKNGTLFILDGLDGSTEWTYESTEREDPETSTDWSGELRYVDMADIDFDGNMDVIFAEQAPSINFDQWPAKLYVFDKNGNQEYDYTIANAGANGALSIVNLDNDNYPEIIVPTFYGIRVIHYDPGEAALEEIWSNSDGMIEGSAVVYDVDKDNEYELIYTTSNPGFCDAAKTCQNKLYIRDALTGDNEANSPISLNVVSRVTPAIADLDGDGTNEIVIGSRLSTSTNLSNILAYNPTTGNVVWVFNDSNTLVMKYISPDIADIDNDGDFNVIVADYITNVFFLEDDGTNLFNYSLGGSIGSAPAIGDLDNDGVAELAVKHAGSPINIISMLGGTNIKPVLANISNITVSEGDLVNINGSGEITATDANNDTLIFYYGYPLNDSGLWKTNCSSGRNYSALVMVSDGNLSDWQYVNIEVKDTCNDGPPLIIESLSVLSSSETMKIFEFVILNNWNQTLNEIAWQFDTGETTITADQNITLTANTITSVIIEHNYSSPGSYVANATAYTSNLTAHADISVPISSSGLAISDLTELAYSGSDRTFTFTISNNGTSNISNVNWSLTTGESTIYTKQLISIEAQTNQTVIARHHYSTTGDFKITANASSPTSSASDTITTSVKPIQINQLSMLHNTGTQSTFEFIISNDMNITLNNINWTLDTGESLITAEQFTLLQPQEQTSVFIRHNYTSPGIYSVNATAINASLQDSQNITITIS